ncbi:MAG: hypothetical protein KJ709_09535 [Nanoarchaeota archaeon]|nr:hypothetical protein [Nanoarchaeota archaeon]
MTLKITLGLAAVTSLAACMLGPGGCIERRLNKGGMIMYNDPGKVYTQNEYYAPEMATANADDIGGLVEEPLE